MDAFNSVASQFVKTLGPMGVIILTFSALSPVTSVNLYRSRKGYGWVLPDLSEPDYEVSF